MNLGTLSDLLCSMAIGFEDVEIHVSSRSSVELISVLQLLKS